MTTIPLLPESAPFTPAQRAWLNGFFAGLLGLGAEGNGSGQGHAAATAGAAGTASIGAAEAEVEEEFPWHDPAIPIDERLRLAEGRSDERKLMAAMAQLDCGACGYLCKTYAEAIASGEEKCLTKCTPGGKETARKLKELVAAHGAVTTSGAAMKSVVAGNGNGNGNGPATVTTSGATM